MDRANFKNEPCQPLHREMGEAPFNDSWEAEAYAMGNLLVKLNHLSSKEWMELMAESIKEAQNHGDPDTGKTYYNHWCRSLEKFCFLTGLSDPEQHQSILELWKKAISNTPHGVPLAIENAFLDDEEHHDIPSLKEHVHHDPIVKSDSLDRHHSHERPATPPKTYYAPIAIQILKS